MNYSKMDKEALLELNGELREQYNNIKKMGMKLDMSRGKPGREQVELAIPMLEMTDNGGYMTKDGEDCLNYGILDGLKSMKKIFAEILEVGVENIFVGGNSSLNMMFDVISDYMIRGVCDGTPWINQGKIKFLCPVPGYDRHFAILEHFNIEPITVPMLKTGPDMDVVENLVSNDDKIKGIWCVPKYSNPQGITYSDETVKRFANLKPKAKDFRIFWDNAYAVHSFGNKDDKLLNLFEECKKIGSEDLPIMFASTSKITIPGAGIAAVVALGENLKQIKDRYAVQTIGYDKVNQLRHTKFLKDYSGVISHMKKNKAILKPKFDMVINMLKMEFADNDIISFTEPSGGYFVSVDVMDGCAKKVVNLCKNAGLILTSAGATYPKGKDLYDRNIRIAPTYPKLEELEKAMRLFCLCVKIASIEKLLQG